MSSTSPSPYLGLRAFTADDAERFFARDVWTKIVVGNVVASRLTVLYAESGVGKTSLLQAGVEHELAQGNRRQNRRPRRSRAIPIVFRAWQGEPVRPLIDRVHASARTVADGSVLTERHGDRAPGSLTDALRRCADRGGGRVVLILDQFEEYLLYHGHDEGPESLPSQLARTIDEPGLQASVLISIREDALSRLDPLRRAIPHLFDNLLHLERVDRQAAAATITGPLRWYNEHYGAEGERIEIEEGLVQEVLGQVVPGAVPLPAAGRDRHDGETPGNGETVELAYLQLVLQRLWSEGLRRGLRRLGIEILAELPGGAEEIVRDHVRQAVEGLSEQERDLAAKVFHYLVTPSGGKIAYTVGDLAKQAECEREVLDDILERLSSAEARVLRPVGVATSRGIESGVEIYHDKLAEPILYWRSEHDRQREREQAELNAREAERRRLRRLRIGALVVVAISVALVMTGLLLAALHEKRLANNEKRLASSRGISAAASSQLGQDPELSLLLGLEAVDAGSTSQAREALRAALVESRVRRVLRGHQATVSPIAFTPDGLMLVTGSNDQTVRIWDVRTGRSRTRPIQTGAAVRDMELSSDGRRIATASGPRLAMWSIATGRPIARPVTPGHGNVFPDVALSPDGRLVAAGASDHRVYLWRPGRPARALGSQGGSVMSVSFAPDGRRLVTSSSDGARIWATRSRYGRPLHHLGTGPTPSVAFSRDGKLVVTAGAHGTARLWDAGTGRLRHILRSHRRSLTTAVFSPNGKLVATGSSDQTARVWDTATGELRTVLGGHTGTVRRIEFSPKGRRIATSSQDGTVRVWVTSSGRSVLVLRGHAGVVQRALFSPNGQKVATSSIDGTARIWEVDPEREATNVLPAADRRALVAAFTGRGSDVAYVASTGSLTVWSAETGRLRPHPGASDGRASTARFSADGKRAAILGRAGRVRVIDVVTGRSLPLRTPRGTRRATIGANGREVVTLGHRSAQLWSAETGRLIATLDGPDGLTDAAVSNDGRFALTTGSKGQATLWRNATSHPISTPLAGDDKRLTKAAFSADGSLAAVAGADGTVRIYDVALGRYRTSLLGHAGSVRDVAFSSDGTAAVTSGSDGTARVWNPRTGKSLAYLGEHGGPVQSATFSPDGRFVLDLMDDGSARLWLWGVGGGDLAERLAAPSRLESARFDLAGKRVVAAAADGSVRIYSCEVCGGQRDLVRLARARETRSLTGSERRAFAVEG